MHYVIIGNSAAGIGACEAIRSVDSNSSLTVISEEDAPIYSRCLISYFLAGSLPKEKLEFRSKEFYKQNNLRPLLGIKVEKILAKDKEIKLSNGEKIEFDKLLIACGARPKLVDIPGADIEGVFGFRTLRDTEEILARLPRVKTACVLGGGLIGLKAAYGLFCRNIKVKLIVKSDQLLSQMLDKQAAGIFQRRIQAEGIEVFTGLAAKEVLGKKEVKGLVMDDGSQIDCQLVIIGKGVIPNVEWIKNSGIDIGRGVIVDSYQKTNMEGVFSAGDVCETKDILSGKSGIFALWPCASEQGRIAGLNMAGRNLSYNGSLMMNSVEFFDLPVISIGIVRKEEGCQEQTIEDKRLSIYKKIILKNKKLIGAILVNHIDNAGILATLIKKKIDISKIKDLLLKDSFDYAKVVPLIKEQKEFNEKEFRQTTISYF